MGKLFSIPLLSHMLFHHTPKSVQEQSFPYVWLASTALFYFYATYVDITQLVILIS